MSQYQVLNPATGVVEQEFATATDAQCRDAITAADNAHKAWSKVPVAERAAIVHRIGQLHIDRQEGYPPESYYGSFLDLFLAARARCIAFGWCVSFMAAAKGAALVGRFAAGVHRSLLPLFRH